MCSWRHNAKKSQFRAKKITPPRCFAHLAASVVVFPLRDSPLMTDSRKIDIVLAELRKPLLARNYYVWQRNAFGETLSTEAYL